jgi:hypothetical protein
MTSRTWKKCIIGIDDILSHFVAVYNFHKYMILSPYSFSLIDLLCLAYLSKVVKNTLCLGWHLDPHNQLNTGIIDVYPVSAMYALGTENN